MLHLFLLILTLKPVNFRHKSEKGVLEVIFLKTTYAFK